MCLLFLHYKFIIIFSGVLNTSLINPMLGKTQAVTFQRAPVALPVRVATSPLTLQQQQLTNITLQQVPKVVANASIQGQNVTSTGILGQAVASAGIPTLAVEMAQSQAGTSVGMAQSKAGTSVGMAQSKAGTSMGKALGLTFIKTAQSKMESTVDSPSQSKTEQSAAENTSISGQKTEMNKTDSGITKTDIENSKEETDKKEQFEMPLGDGKSAAKEQEDFDATEALTWDNGIGTLPGSDLKVSLPFSALLSSSRAQGWVVQNSIFIILTLRPGFCNGGKNGVKITCETLLTRGKHRFLSPKPSVVLGNITLITFSSA
jgi:hypothetical protein